MRRVGLMIEGQQGPTWERLLRLAEATERLGFGSLHRSDHLTGIEGDSERATGSLWPSLAFASLPGDLAGWRSARSPLWAGADRAGTDVGSDPT